MKAGIVTCIFKEYAAGKSPRIIAHALNAEGVAGPRGGERTPSVIYGDRRARDGIQCQELYIGVRVYNRRQFRLMQCSLCGSGITMNGQKFACSVARERGTCNNTKIIAAKSIEARILDGIAPRLRPS